MSFPQGGPEAADTEPLPSSTYFDATRVPSATQPTSHLGRVPVGAAYAGRQHTPRHDGWTAHRKRTFLEALARCGNVRNSAAFAGISHEAAYSLRRRDPAFAAAWAGALVQARDVALDILADKAMNGIEEELSYHGEITATRTRFDGRLLLALLGRLDNMSESDRARIGAARFDALLERIDRNENADDLLEAPLEPVPGDNCTVESPEQHAERCAREQQEDWAEREARIAAARTAPEDVDISDLDPAAMDEWSGEQWVRADHSGLAERIFAAMDEMGLEEWPEGWTLKPVCAAGGADAADVAGEPARSEEVPGEEKVSGQGCGNAEPSSGDSGNGDSGNPAQTSQGAEAGGEPDVTPQTPGSGTENGGEALLH